VVFGASLLGGQPAQQAGQLDAFALGQGGADLVLVAGSGGLYLAERVLALRGQVQRVGAPVGGVAAAFDQAVLFEFVDQEDPPGRMWADSPAVRLLGRTLVRRRAGWESRRGGASGVRIP